MFKKMMKVALAVALVAGMATTATAETKIGGKIAAYFGQYTSGAEGDASYFDEVDEANLNVVTKRGPVTGLLQIEADRSGGDYIHNTRRFVKYQMDEMLSFKIGTNVTGVPFSILSGTKAHTVPGEFIGVYWGFAEGDGLGIDAKLGEGMNAQLTLYDGDVITNPFTNDTAASGSGTQVGFNGNFGAVAARFSYIMGNTDNHSDATPDATSSSAYNLGVKYSMEGMAFSLDIFNEVINEADPNTGNALQARIGAGPGTVIVTLASRTASDKTATAWTNLVYDVSLDKGAGLQALYTSAATTPDGGDATTKSYIGAGFYAGF